MHHNAHFRRSAMGATGEGHHLQGTPLSCSRRQQNLETKFGLPALSSAPQELQHDLAGAGKECTLPRMAQGADESKNEI